MPKLRRSVLLPVLILAALAGAGCTGVRGGAKKGLPGEPQRSPSGDAVAPQNPPPPPVERPGVAEAIDEARTLFELGRQHYQRGDMPQARANFDRAIERLTSFPAGARGDARLSDAYADLLHEIQDLETSSYQSGSGLAPASELPPLEDLGEIVPEITPEQAAADREMLEDAEITTDIPVILNDKVLAWMDIYRGHMKDRFQEGLTRSGRYIDMIRRIFKEEGLPQDLAYMAHVESAYKVYAYSRARAKGVWQFIAGTGRRYGLRRDWWIDERSDPELATRAAAAYLKDLHAMFGDWYLAMAAYNAGEGKIQRGMHRTGARDFWALAKTSHIRLETKNYVPAILAAIVLSKNPRKFGFSLEKEPAILWDSVEIDSATDLRVVARLAGSTVEDIRTLNPALARLQTPPNYPDFELRVPQGTGDQFAQALGQLARSERIPWKSHKVSKGETLASLSRRYGVSVARIREANGLASSEHLRSGAELQIPTYVAPAATGHRDITRTRRAGVSTGTGQKLVHKVHRGDTLSSIARRYKTTVSALQSWNRLPPNSKINPGDRIVIYRGRSRPSAARSGATGGASIGDDSPSSSGSRESSAATTYRVRSGDTLFSIASRLSTSVEKICRLNNLSTRDTIFPGMLLTIDR